MRIYRLSSDTTYRCLCWDQESLEKDRLEGEFVRQFRSGAPIDPWFPPPIRFQTAKEDREGRDRGSKPGELSDSPFYSAATLFLSSRAREALLTTLQDHGQFLPVPIPGNSEGLFVFNCTTVLDALDREKSDVELYASGTPRRVRRLAWDQRIVGGTAVFRLQWPPTYALYISEAVADLIARAELTGFVLSEL
jgi:hypothetical protein